MAMHRQNSHNRVAVTDRTSGMEQHLLSGFVLALAALAVLLTIAG